MCREHSSPGPHIYAGDAHHGTIPRITPIASLKIMALCPSVSTTGTLPHIDVMRLATSRNVRTASGTTMPEEAPTSAPISWRIYSALISRRASRISAALSRMSRLTVGFVCDHKGKASARPQRRELHLGGLRRRRSRWLCWCRGWLRGRYLGLFLRGHLYGGGL